MILYHGSSVGGLTQLEPSLSEHQKPYVYLASNPVVALLYTVKPVPKPFSFYPYGFRGEKVIYSEYYPNCFEDIYKGKKGFLYVCDGVENAENPTAINCAYTSKAPVRISSCLEIEDVFERFMQYKNDGLFEIKPFEAISKNELDFVYGDLKNTVLQYSLKSQPDNPMSRFIINHFPEVWENK